jgi:putative MATE family efflux protein
VVPPWRRRVPGRPARAGTPWPGGRRPRRSDRDILALAVPALAGLAAEPLFLLADSAIIGHLGTPELAGFGVASAVLLNAVYLCIFLAFGTTASVARLLGARRPREAFSRGAEALCLALGIGLILSVTFLALAPQFVSAFGTSPAAEPHALTYLRISALGLPALLLVMAASGALRGTLDARTPTVVAVAAALANVPLNFVLVYGFGLGVAGSAIGTIIAQWGAALWLVRSFIGRAVQQGARPRPRLRGVLAAGAAQMSLFARTVTLRIALLGCTYVAAAHGDVSIAGHQIAFTLWSFIAIVSESLGLAAQALVGRHLGASDVAATRLVTQRVVWWSLVTGLVIGLALVLLRPVIVPAFTDDPEVRRLLGAVLLVIAATQPVGSVVFALDGVLIGAGDNRYLALAGVASLLAFVPMAGSVLATSAGLVALWWALGGYLLARLAAHLLRIRNDAWIVTGAIVGRAAGPEQA